MSLGRRVSKDVAEPYEADRRLAATYRDRLAAATGAEHALRAAQADERPAAELRPLARTFEAALTEVLAAAEAGERVEMGPKVYVTGAQDAKARRTAEIARRRAGARHSVRPWTAEVDRLRTARETHKLSFRPGPAIGV
ncbi:plectin [Spirillospora sp. NBC_01491]|uniref:plectin n=1 Tax=Spirillospora sp. NBC_01491 TaxID=2976007 RepID=UPI002E31BFEB|nr:plectin [Spirillospora sp. NBC_01491]